MSHADIDVALLYDHFSPMVLMQLEDYGFCAKGEGGSFVESGAIRYKGGSIPVNTHGGQLSEAYIIGMTHIREAVEQMRGTAISQVLDAEPDDVHTAAPELEATGRPPEHDVTSSQPSPVDERLRMTRARAVGRSPRAARCRPGSTHCRDHQSVDPAPRPRAGRCWREAAVELYGSYPAMPFTDLAAEVASEIRLLRATQAGLDAHATQREDAYRWADPGGLARSLPGLAAIGAPAHRPALAVGVSGLQGAWDVLGAIIGDASRFPTARHFA